MVVDGISLPKFPWSTDSQVGIRASNTDKDNAIDSLISKMTIDDLVLQLHLMFADDIVGKDSMNELYDSTMSSSPDSPLGVMHDWYPMDKKHFNSVQKLQFEKSHLHIPMMLLEECLHGVGSWQQSIFPQNLAMAASWDTDIVYRVGRAIGTEARSIGVVGCYSPVLDLGRDPRWGRVQEAFGEDMVLTSHIGVAYSSGLSKNKTWSDPDAVFPVMKHFAAHGSAQGGRNAAPFTDHGWREIMASMLVPFKAVYELGGARATMIAYNEIDGVPNAVNPILYKALADWDFDGFTIADDTCVHNLISVHQVADSEASALTQWFNAGGMIDYYDFDLDTYLATTKELVANGSVPLKTLQSHVRKILGVKWDAGLFERPYISESIDPQAIVESHKGVALDAAHRSIVLLKNDNSTLPLKSPKDIKIALVGPFADTVNLGDYSGQLGQRPMDSSTTIRQGILEYLHSVGASADQLKNAWGCNSWEYNNQYAIPGYLMSAKGKTGGLEATYYADTSFRNPEATRLEVPFRDWGLYPPPGLSSNNFSATWEGEVESPVDTNVQGWIGIAIGANTTAKLYIDGHLTASSGFTESGDLLGNIEPFSFIQANSTLPPQGGTEFKFTKGAKYQVRIEYQTWNLDKKYANIDSINSQVMLWWNLVTPNGGAMEQAVSVAQNADVIVLTVGAAWNSDAESGDRATLDLAPSQDALAKAMYALGKPVVLLLEGGRPFAIPDHYGDASAVLNTFFGGQAAGTAIADVLFGEFNPGGRMPITIPYNVGQLPMFYNYKPSARSAQYLDISSDPAYPFGYGLSYTTFATSSFKSSSTTFSRSDFITFSASIKNTGDMTGSYVAEVYLLGRVSTVTQPVKQLVAFQRVYLDAGHEATVSMQVEVDRYLMTLNRDFQWELEKGSYTFALLEHGGSDADTSINVTMQAT